MIYHAYPIVNTPNYIILVLPKRKSIPRHRSSTSFAKLRLCSARVLISLWSDGRTLGADAKPVGTRFPLGDTLAGVQAALAICAALFYRGKGGVGQYIDISMADSLFTVNNLVQTCTVFGTESLDLLAQRFTPYAARDGYMLIQVRKQAMYDQLGKAMGQPRLFIDDSRFNTDERRDGLGAL